MAYTATVKAVDDATVVWRTRARCVGGREARARLCATEPAAVG